MHGSFCMQKRKEIGKMKKLFISQPMQGKGDQEILDERAEAIRKAQQLIGEPVEVLETFYDDFGPDAKPLEYLARSIADLSKADVAFFARGWDERRGCKIEHQCAADYGIPTLEYQKQNAFGEFVKERISEMDISIREFACKCNITETSMHRYVDGARTPRGTEFVNIAAGLEVTPEEILALLRV